MKNEISVNRNFLRETIELRKSIDEGFLNLGERLKKIRDNKLYEIDYESFDLFLSELKISSGTASKLIQIYEIYILEYKISYEKLSQSNWTSLYEMLPLATSKEKAVNLVEHGSLMRREDIKSKVREAKFGKNCKHQYYELHIKQCKVCGERIIIN